MENLKNSSDGRYSKIQEFKSLSDQKDGELKTIFTADQYNLYLNGFQLVNAPVRAYVSELPESKEKVVVGDEIYYEQYGTLYKKVETDQGFAYIIAGTL